MRRRICISGVGVVSPIGVGREAYWRSLAAGQDGVTEVSLFDRSTVRSRLGASVNNFDAAQLVGSRGLKFIDRLAQFAIAAAKLAIEDARLLEDELDANRRGLVVGTAFGSLSSQQEFNHDRVLEGPRWVSPLKFPNTPINALSYQIPIRFQMRLFSVTLSAGMTSSFEAIRYALLMLQHLPEAVLLCGGAEELSFHAFHSTYFLNELAGTSGPELSCPFDERHNGYILGEGCALLALESLEVAQRRGAQPLAEICGWGSAHASWQAKPAERTAAVATAMRSAITDAGLRPEQVDFISAAANSDRQLDLIEAQAITEVFGSRAATIPVSAVKSMLGEAFGAAGAMQVAAALLALERGILPPVVNLQQLDPECAPLNCVAEARQLDGVRYALVNSIDRYGSAASLVLGRAE